jgi:aspartate aminotransferase
MIGSRGHWKTQPRLAPTLSRALDFTGNRFLMFVLDAMAEELERVHDDVIRLTLGKSEAPPARQITDAMVAALEDATKSALVYPAGLPELRQRIAGDYRARYGLDVDWQQVIVSVGSSTMFRNLFTLLLEPGDGVLLPLPYYPLYRVCALLSGAQVDYYRISADGLRLDLDSVAAGLTPATRVVVLNSPGNPLGNVLDRSDLLEVDRLVAGRATVISDEIYRNIWFDERPPSVLDVEDWQSPLVVTNAFSKGYRMYSRRVGYAVVPASLVEPLTVIQHHTLLTTDPVAQFGALAAIDCPEEVEALRQRYLRRRDYTVRRLGDIAGLKVIRARGSFYITLDCAELMRDHSYENSLALATEILRQTHVATVPGSDFGLPGALRLSFSSARYEEAIDRLAGFFARPEPLHRTR